MRPCASSRHRTSCSSAGPSSTRPRPCAGRAPCAPSAWPRRSTTRSSGASGVASPSVSAARCCASGPTSPRGARCSRPPSREHERPRTGTRLIGRDRAVSRSAGCAVVHLGPEQVADPTQSVEVVHVGRQGRQHGGGYVGMAGREPAGQPGLALDDGSRSACSRSRPAARSRGRSPRRRAAARRRPSPRSARQVAVGLAARTVDHEPGQRHRPRRAAARRSTPPRAARPARAPRPPGTPYAGPGAARRCAAPAGGSRRRGCRRRRRTPSCR